MSPRLPIGSESTAPDAALGVCCPRCQARARVVDIDRLTGLRNWRRHVCPKCGTSFSSNETVDLESVKAPSDSAAG